MVKRYTVGGMTCSACQARVERCVERLEGVEEVTVNLLTGAMSVTSITDMTDAIRKAVVEAGYTLKEGVSHKRANERERKLLGRLKFSIPLVLVLMYVAMGSMIGLPVPKFLNAAKIEGAIIGSTFQAVVAAAVMIINFDYYRAGFKNLFKLSPNMDSLVALGSSASFLYGIFSVIMIIIGKATANEELMHGYMHNLYFEGAAMIVTLISLGKYLEEKSKNKTMSAIGRLLALAPDKALIEVGGNEVEIAASELKKGDTVILKDGFSIPCDGKIIDGQGYTDESAITGESMPVYKSAGDAVICGTVFSGGYCRVSAENVGEDSTVYKIVKLVEDANSTKVPIAKVADKVAGYFVPTVMGISLAAFAVWLIAGYGLSFAVNIAVSILVVSCPCALGLATPVALMAGTGKAAENGILVKSGEALQKLAAVDTVMLDKTGTLTANKPVIKKVEVFGIDEDEFIRLAASAEKSSSHPLAKPVLDMAENRGVSLVAAENFNAVAGKGLTATVSGKRVAVGNIKLAEEELNLNGDEKSLIERIATGNATVLFVGVNGAFIGYMTVEDSITDEARQAVKQFKEMKLDVVMLTGDNVLAAQKVADELGIDYKAEVLPEDKLLEVNKATERGGKVVMVGDGVNDAPALTAAYVGMAIGAGTDIAIESADAVLIKSDLRDVAGAIKLGKSVMRNIKENLFWAFFYNVILIPIACGALYPFGITMNPMFASAAMSLSSVSVVLNALRLNFVKLGNNSKTEKNKGEEKMNGNTVTVYIDGMMCEHCQKRVREVFKGLGIDAEVDLKKKRAIFENTDVAADDIISAIESAGYTVKKIEK